MRSFAKPSQPGRQYIRRYWCRITWSLANRLTYGAASVARLFNTDASIGVS